MKNKILSLVLVFIFLISICSCSKKESKNDKYSIICTAFSQYDFVKEIVGEKADMFNIDYLFDNGADVHSFENDISFDVKIKILSADVFIYNGGESDSWAKDIIDDKSMNKNCKSVSLLDCLDHKTLIKSGTDIHHDESCDDGHDHGEYDEHIWLSLKNTIQICQVICENICSIDPTNENIYKQNSENYVKRLSELDKSFESYVESISKNHVIVADRFPFAYLFNDYKIPYTAAFSGCTSETEATYNSIIRLCDDIEKYNVSVLVVLENSNSNISDSIISAIGKDMKRVTINSLQSVSRDEINNGISYYSAMQENLNSIKTALE